MSKYRRMEQEGVMEKTGQMIEFEEETGGYAIVTVKVGFAELQFPSEVYVEWIEAELLKASVKAAAYDRIMSSGKKTLKEWANFLGKPVAVDNGVTVWAYDKVPERSGNLWLPIAGRRMYQLPRSLVDFSGGWKASLTLPDGWEESK